MSHQIRFYLCSAMRTAIESEEQRIGATMVASNAWGTQAIEFRIPSEADTPESRLWTEAADPTDYESLCRAVKRGAVYDRESSLWVKRTSLEAFRAYRAEKQKALDELVQRNRQYAIEVLGGRIAKDEG